jgi:hypothetical protein
MRPVTNRSGAALVLLLLLVSGPLALSLPGEIGAVRLAGVSLIWWYEGLVAPCAAALVALRCLPARAKTPRAE